MKFLWSSCRQASLCTCVYQPGHPTESRHLLSSPKDHWPPTSYYMSAPFCLLKRSCNTFSSHHWNLRKSMPDPYILFLPSSPSRAWYNFDLWLCLLTVFWDMTSSSTFDPMSWMEIRGTQPCTLSGIVGTSVIGEEDQSLSSWDFFIWKRMGWTRSVDCKWVSLVFKHPVGGLGFTNEVSHCRLFWILGVRLGDHWKAIRGSIAKIKCELTRSVWSLAFTSGILRSSLHWGF